MSDINPVETGVGNFNPQGPFNDSSDANKSLVSDIQKITASQPPTLSPGLLRSAKAAGEMASNARTIEDKQNIYKSYLSKANQGNQETTKGMVKDWENAAEFFRNQK